MFGAESRQGRMGQGRTGEGEEARTYRTQQAMFRILTLIILEKGEEVVTCLDTWLNIVLSNEWRGTAAGGSARRAMIVFGLSRVIDQSESTIT